MKIHNIKVTNFKSMYGTHYFDFDKCTGLVKLSGPIGVGKSSLGESLVYGLFGAVKGQNNGNLISWNCRTAEVEMTLTSKNKKIHIIRNMKQPLIVEVDGKTLSASNKRDTQAILEEELYDVPKLALLKMCIISFNAFNSLASMSIGETKQFLDEVFGFKLFSEYNNEIVIERKNYVAESVKLQALYEENQSQIANLIQKKATQHIELSNSVDIDALNEEREKLVQQGIAQKSIKNNYNKELLAKSSVIKVSINEHKSKMTEYSTLGKKEKYDYNTFKSGVCPTCGQKIDKDHIQNHKDKMMEYANLYKEHEAEVKKLETSLSETTNEYEKLMSECDTIMSDLREKISKIDNEISIYNNSVQLIDENYDNLIKEYEDKGSLLQKQISDVDIEIGEWNEMNDLFSKTLRYNLLESLIPHVNKSIQFFIDKLDQPFRVEYDEEFKPHIFTDIFDKEISYSNLSTGQKKSLDLAIIFGILHNIIANVDCNILFLDELFSNMDSNSRNTMLELLKEQLSKDKSIFIINHAEMSDDYFDHKIRVHIENKKIISESIRKGEDVIIKASRYEQIF